MKKTCKGCQTDFETTSIRALYCCHHCRKRKNSQQRRDEIKIDRNVSRYPKIIRKKNKKGEYISESTKTYFDYWQG